MHGLHNPLDYELGAFEDWCDYGRADSYYEDSYDDPYYYYDLGPEEDDFGWDDEWIDQYVPSQAGGTQPKVWWAMSRKDDSVEYQLRRRRRDYEIRVTKLLNHGRDLAECWEARDRGRRRKLKQGENEFGHQFLYRANKLRRQYQRADRRKARQTIRKLKAPEFHSEYGPENFLEDHLDY